MADCDPHLAVAESDGRLAVRRLRRIVVARSVDDGDAGGWRDDLRLFALMWALGFLFFLVMIA